VRGWDCDPRNVLSNRVRVGRLVSDSVHSHGSDVGVVTAREGAPGSRCTGGPLMSRRMYTCDHGEFTPAPRGYYRLAPVLLVGTILLGLNVAVSAGFALLITGVLS